MKTNILLSIAVLLVAVLSMMIGSVEIPIDQVFNAIVGKPVEKASWAYIVTDSRLPQTITALLCGASLAASGLLLQTAFHNPLAGPSILGITNGASMGVSIVMLACGGVIGIGGNELFFSGFLATIVAAFIGAMVIIGIILAFASIVKNNLMLLIIGIMVGYLSSSLVSLLYFFADVDDVHSFTMWGLGSFSNVSLAHLPWFAGVSLISLCIAILLIKPLNIIQLGDEYATSLGINIKRTRRALLLSTGLLTAVATAFCGPITFIGLAVPHIARLICRTSDHRTLLPATILCGALIAVLCNIACVLPSNIIIPINAVTPLFGAPVIIYILIRKRK